MSHAPHHYALHTRWTGAGADGTRDYLTYGRDFTVEIAGKPPLHGSADPAFHGDAAVANPEDWLLAALSGCHMLSYLALCARRRVQVLAYEDAAEARMVVHADGGGEFASVTLRPLVTVADDADSALALALHQRAHALCFIARSCSAPIEVRASVRRAADVPRDGAPVPAQPG